MKSFKVTFANGNSLNTQANGDYHTISKYYIGNDFNLGSVDDDIQTAVKVRFDDEKRESVFLFNDGHKIIGAVICYNGFWYTLDGEAVAYNELPEHTREAAREALKIKVSGVDFKVDFTLI